MNHIKSFLFHNPLIFINIICLLTATAVPVLAASEVVQPQVGRPVGKLIQDGNGNLYGAIGYGGEGEFGSIFRIDSSGTYTVLHSFDGTNGWDPRAGVILGQDGKLYGTTNNGGVADNGTIFQIDITSATPTYTVLHSFDGINGAHPWAGVTQGKDGKLYGTTFFGGASYGIGTVYQLDISSLTPVYKVLHSFVFEGNYPVSEVIQGADGNLYGTTSTGGSLGGGIVFKIDLSLTEPVTTVLHSFDVVDITSEATSNNPLSSVVQGCDNKLYGTTSNDGKNKAGTIYQIDISGPTPIFNVLHEFAGSTGDSANASLIKGKNCKFYGTTNPADTTQKAIAFLLDTSIATPCYRTLYEFNKSDGSSPPAGLLEGNDGKFYGITSDGGQKNYGTVYQLDFGASVAAYKTLHHFDAPITNASQPPATDPGNTSTQDKTVSPVALASPEPAPTNPPENVAPVANSDSFVLMSAKKIMRIIHAAPGVMMNDSDADNIPLAVVGATVSIPKMIDLPRDGGKVALHANGRFDYIPRKKCFTGTRNFSYQVTDGQSTSTAATVTLTIKKNRSCR